MISILSSGYTKNEYRALYDLLCRANNCTVKGELCETCRIKRPCQDIDKVLDYLREKIK